MKTESILVVDDDLDFLKEIESALSAGGYEVFTASTGIDARNILSKANPAIVLLDKKLSDMDGQKLVDEVRSKLKSAQCIIITGYGTMDSAIEGLREGVIDYITKPADPQYILGRIENALKAKEDELRGYTKRLEETVERRTMDLQATVSELDKANQKLRHYDALKSEFVGNVAHEINNPLSVIKSALTTISDGLTGQINEKTKDFVDMSIKESERLLRFTKDMLDLSKIEAGKMPAMRLKVELRPLLDESLMIFKDECEKNGIGLESDIADNLEWMWADRDLLKQVLINLLSNAVKYTPRGKAIRFKALRVDGALRLEIKDEGPGIPRELQDKIFDKFYRIFEDRKTGTGLGLSITKEIVELHKGRIWVESEVGRGTTFIVALPLDFRGG